MASPDGLTAIPAAARAPGAAKLLRVDDLSVSYGPREVVSKVAFQLGHGESLALIGESGSGKSTVARAVLRLLPRDARATGRVEYNGEDVLALSERRFRPLRGRALGFIPQDPGAALNPVRTIGSQALEAVALLDEPDSRRRKAFVLETFAEVGLDNPARVFDSYPHQLSGGMLQRVLIGLAVLPRPALLVADEPTSAIDVTIQKRILDLISRLRNDLDISLLLITHDLAIAAERADSLVVLKDGVVQEAGGAAAVFAAPASAYTRKLRADAPALNPNRYAELRDRSHIGAQARRIDFAGVSKSFRVGGRTLTAVENLSFSVPAGRTHALVGESGSGKTTAVRLLLGLEAPDCGKISLTGETISDRPRASMSAVWRDLQLVYQNPFASLDPTWTVEQLVREPLDRFRIGTRAQRVERVRAALASVGLADDLGARKPAALSGGQRQRAAIARALVLEPEVIVFDEPTSALDVSVQADIVEALLWLQAELGLTYLFVSHDLALVRQLAHSVSVMHRGRIVEQGSIADVFDNPRQPYTRSLLGSIPSGIVATLRS